MLQAPKGVFLNRALYTTIAAPVARGRRFIRGKDSTSKLENNCESLVLSEAFVTGRLEANQLRLRWTVLAGFAGARRPHAPSGRTPISNRFQVGTAVPRRTPVPCSFLRKGV